MSSEHWLLQSCSLFLCLSLYPTALHLFLLWTVFSRPNFPSGLIQLPRTHQVEYAPHASPVPSSLGVSAGVKKITVVVTWLQGCIKTDCVCFTAALYSELFCSKLGLILSSLLTMPGLYAAVCSQCGSSLCCSCNSLPCLWPAWMGPTCCTHPVLQDTTWGGKPSHPQRPWFPESHEILVLPQWGRTEDFCVEGPDVCLVC